MKLPSRKRENLSKRVSGYRQKLISKHKDLSMMRQEKIYTFPIKNTEQTE
jgi:hypothetical protein